MKDKSSCVRAEQISETGTACATNFWRTLWLYDLDVRVGDSLIFALKANLEKQLFTQLC